MYKKTLPKYHHRVSSLSIFFPAYNDVATIEDLVAQAQCVASSITDDFEIVVVNDGSADGTGALLDRLAEKNNFLRVVHHSGNRGYGSALISGFSHATKDWVFYTDGDGQYDVSELRNLLKKVRPGLGMVNGYKVSRGDHWTRSVMGITYHAFVKRMFDLKIRDTDCDFRLIRRNLLEGLQLRTSSGAICVELVHKIQRTGCEIAEVPVNHYPRKAGRSQFLCVKHVSRTLFHLPKLWFTLGREKTNPTLSTTLSASLSVGY